MRADEGRKCCALLAMKSEGAYRSGEEGGGETPGLSYACSREEEGEKKICNVCRWDDREMVSSYEVTCSF